jgi:hypothetical protein
VELDLGAGYSSKDRYIKEFLVLYGELPQPAILITVNSKLNPKN